jgi:hypothetical protein
MTKWTELKNVREALTGYIMLLSRNREVIEILNHILKDYDFLVYDLSKSRNKPYLQVRVINPERAQHDISVAGFVCRELGQMTGECLCVHAYVFADVLTHFRISEDKL